MTIDIVTLFPEMFENFLKTSIIKRAITKELVKINIHNLRDYSNYKNKQVDEYPYGGGAGMVLMCEPVFNAVDALKKENTKVIMTTPSGITYNQDTAINLSKETHLIILCGHYEGFDERIRTICDYEISIGNYVLTGGEIPAMVITDSVTRLINGVISKESLISESFNNGLLDYPNYTKPEVFKGMKVPEVLLSGHHQKIDEYRHSEQVKKTNELKNK